MATVKDVRDLGLTLPRSTEVWVRGRRKFRVGQIVYVAFDRAEDMMGCGFPKEERAAMVAAEPDKFVMPGAGDLRYQWIEVRLDAVDADEARELVLDAWRMCVPKGVSAEYLGR